MKGRREYIIEFHPVGAYVKVSAIDPITGREVCIVGDAHAEQTTLTRLAIQKLEYVLQKS